MTSVWRNRIFRRQTTGVRLRLWMVCRGLCLIPGLVGVVVLPGCAWVRAQAQHRSDECEQLCAQADQAQESGHVERADQLLDEALRKAPRDLEVQKQLADSLWHVGRQRDALQQLTRLADEHPQDVRLAITLAGWLVEAGRYDEALDRLQPCLASECGATRSLELKAQIETAQGNDEAALMTYQRLGQQEASQSHAMVQMAKIYLERGHPERAAPLFRLVLAHPRASADQKAVAHWDLGVAYAQLARWPDAAGQLAEASPQREMTADDWHAVAYAQYRADDTAAAQASLDHALGLEPRHHAGQKLAGILLQTEALRHDDPEVLLPVGFERIQESDRRPLP